jgi:hypothetical protein
MSSLSSQEAGQPDFSSWLAALLDKLVALQMHPAPCHRTSVLGRNTIKAASQLDSLASTAKLTRVAGSSRRG